MLILKDGAPSTETAVAIHDDLDFTWAFRAFTDTFRGVSIKAVRRGFAAAVKMDEEVLICSELLDTSSLFLTANADIVDFFDFVDLSNAPMVVETPSDALGAFDDMWFRRAIDFGAPDPDRGEGGKHLQVGPDCDGSLPEGGFCVVIPGPTGGESRPVLPAGQRPFGACGGHQVDDQDLSPCARRGRLVDRALSRGRRQSERIRWRKAMSARGQTVKLLLYNENTL